MLKLLSCLCSKLRSEIADGMQSTLFSGKCDMPKYSLDLPLRWRSILTNEIIGITYSLAITSLKRKIEERRFIDLKMFLMLHCGNEFLKQVLNFYFKLDGIVPRYGNTIKNSFLEKAGMTFFGT